jgi:methionyl aminopeptidase
MHNHRVVVHSRSEIAGIRAAAAAAAWVRDQLSSVPQAGMSTRDIDLLAARLIRETGGRSAFHGYRGFPGQICISLNDEVVHGIGKVARLLRPGDLVSLDVGVRLNGCVGDTALTVTVGRPRDTVAEMLLKVTRESLQRGVEAARGGGRVSDIGRAVESVVRRAGFSVVRDFVGHGCGTDLHEPPEVPNFAQTGSSPELLPGMVLAIEPMVNTGNAEVTVAEDGWTVRTADGSLSAHFEHMVLITSEEPEILTWPKTASK